LNARQEARVIVPTRSVLALALFVTLTFATTQRTADGSNSAPWLDAYREAAARLIGEALSDTFAWRRLSVLTDTIGHRLSGSPQLDRAIQWAVDEMKRDGLENVHTEPVIVPKWIRGAESAEIVEPARHSIVMLGLGGSVATPPEGIEAELMVARSFEELDANASRANGAIVLLNVPFTTYNETVRARSSGASRAGRHGARAVLVRSIGPAGLRLPHTGALQYASDAPKIPAAAIAAEDADRLQRMADRLSAEAPGAKAGGSRIVVRLKMEAHFEPDVESANIVGEIRGRERPDEVVVVSGHLDSWDVGAGATDDGGGCIVTWEALRMLKKLNLRPRRTVRIVLWTNEENGGRGGLAYRDRHRSELGRHVMMLESDGGVFQPNGFGFTGSDRARRTVTEIATLLRGIGADDIGPAGGGADIGPSVLEAKIPSMSLDVDGSKYFLIHHTPADTVDKIDPVDMAKCAAAVAVMAYVVADMPQRLGE
jgi:carboxypeptidase Q